MFIKLTLLGFAKKTVFLQFFKDLLNGIDVRLTWVFIIEKDII